MFFGRFNKLLCVALIISRWSSRQASNDVISVLMEKRAAFDNNLPLTSACYDSEIKTTSRIHCASQCLNCLDVCKGILFSGESETCRLINCNPADSFLNGSFDTGRWDLFWKTTVINGPGMCKPGWLKHDRHCYFFNPTGNTWMNARTMCEENGGSLASIRSSEENSWIVDTFLPPWNSSLCSPEWWNCCQYWIGGNDLNLEGTFTWTSDNSTVGFVNWYPGEPSDTNNQDCVSICRDEHWADCFCGRVWPYICKAPTI